MLKAADAAANHNPSATNDGQDLTNFGRNLRWRSRVDRPANEAAVLDLLDASHGKTVRVISSGHSWSHVAAHADIALDLGALDSIEPVPNRSDRVRVGAGCRLQRLLDHLRASGRTLPTIGVIKTQTVAGAISTGTHGSGSQSLSHFVTAVRMAVCNASGKWEVREIGGGPELLAARCGVGCVGVLLKIDFETVPNYFVAETVSKYGEVADIIAAFGKFPLSSFALWPHEGYLSVLERRNVDRAPTGLGAWFWKRWDRFFGLVVVDVGFTFAITIVRKLGPRAIKALLRLGPRALNRKRVRLDDAEHVLTMRHDLFRHEEMEIFVRESDLARAIDFAQEAVRFFAGDSCGFPSKYDKAIEQSGLARTLPAARGSMVLHYPIYCRRVLEEDTLISMAASATEPWFSISFFTYERPHKRGRYYDFCLFVLHVLRQLMPVRLHWGKHFPLRYPETAETFPRFDEFRTICERHDPNGMLRNSYTARVLNLWPAR